MKKFHVSLVLMVFALGLASSAYAEMATSNAQEKPAPKEAQSALGGAKPEFFWAIKMEGNPAIIVLDGEQNQPQLQTGVKYDLLVVAMVNGVPKPTSEIWSEKGENSFRHDLRFNLTSADGQQSISKLSSRTSTVKLHFFFQGVFEFNNYSSEFDVDSKELSFSFKVKPVKLIVLPNTPQ